MAYDVHIHVCFPCSQNDGVAALAQKHLIQLIKADSFGRDARWYLEELASRSGQNPGPKGGLSLWGMVGNCTDGDDFVHSLRPFWTDLLASDIDGGPLDFEHILVFTEAEQKERATAYEIVWDEGSGLQVFKHQCPFSWAQA